MLGCRLNHEGEPRRQHQQGHRDPVHPTVQLELGDADPDQIEDPDGGQRVPRQPEGVSERRVRNIRLARVEHCPGGAPDEPEQQGRPEREPGSSGHGLEGGPSEDERRTDAEDRVVDPVVVEPVRAGETEEIIDGLEDGEHRQNQPEEVEEDRHRKELTLLVDVVRVSPAPAYVARPGGRHCP